MLCRIIYTSQSLCNERETLALVGSSREANARKEVTGALYVSEGCFIQYLEGEEMVVNQLFDRIRRDPRHTNCRMTDHRPMFLRVFSEWSMAFLAESSSAAMLMRTLLAQSEGKASEGAVMGAFFYAMARTGECR